MKDVILLQPPASLTNPEPVLPEDAVGIGMLTILAYLKQHNRTGEVIHMPRAFKLGYNMEDVIRRIRDSAPLVIGIGLNWLHFSKGALEVAAIVRRAFPTTPIIVGGQHATLFAEEIVEYCKDIDAVVIGEAEKTVYRIVQQVAEGAGQLTGIPGLVTANGKTSLNPAMTNPKTPIPGASNTNAPGTNASNAIASSPGASNTSVPSTNASNAIAPTPSATNTHAPCSNVPEIVELDALPFYSYREVWPESEKVYAALDTVRGECRLKCSYCIASKANYLQGRCEFAAHSADYLVEQVKLFTEEGLHSVTIQDPFFLTGDELVTAFAEGLRARGIKLSLLNVFAAPGFFNRSTLEALKGAANHVSLEFGVETGAYQVLELLGRRFDKEEVLEHLRLCTGLGIKTLTWWMTGLPGEDEVALAESAAFLEETVKTGTMPRWVTPLVLFPQTDMAKQPEKYGLRIFYKTFIDFLRFSEMRANNAGVYEELLTHETILQNRQTIVQNTLAFKEIVINKINTNSNILNKHGWDTHFIKKLSKSLKGSFY